MPPWDAFDSGGSFGSCWGTTIVPRTDGLTLPSNTPALAFEATRTDGTRTTTVDELGLYNESGELVDATVNADPIAKSFRLVLPTSVLVPGKYTLRVWETCTGEPSGPTTKTIERNFVVGEEVKFPESIGTIVASPDSFGNVELVAKLSPEMVAFLPTSQMSLHMKGKEPSYRYEYGIVTAGTMKATVFPCGGMYGGDIVVGTAVLTAHIAGSTSDPAPVEQEFKVVCPRTPEPVDYWDGGPIGDYDTGPGTGYHGLDDYMDENPGRPSDGCACRQSGPSSAATDLTIGLGGLMVVFGIVRRRTRRTA